MTVANSFYRFSVGVAAVRWMLVSAGLAPAMWQSMASGALQVPVEERFGAYYASESINRLNCSPDARQILRGRSGRRCVSCIQAMTDDRGIRQVPCEPCCRQTEPVALPTPTMKFGGDKLCGPASSDIVWQSSALDEICTEEKYVKRVGDGISARFRSHQKTPDDFGCTLPRYEGLTPAPGTRSEFGAHVEAWLEMDPLCQ